MKGVLIGFILMFGSGMFCLFLEVKKDIKSPFLHWAIGLITGTIGTWVHWWLK